MQEQALHPFSKTRPGLVSATIAKPALRAGSRSLGEERSVRGMFIVSPEKIIAQGEKVSAGESKALLEQNRGALIGPIQSLIFGLISRS